MRTICLYFEIHQIIHLKRYRCFDIGRDHYYYDDYENERGISDIAERSYIPALSALIEMAKNHGDTFKVALSISGVALEQLEVHAPGVIELLHQLNETGCCEFLCEPYSHGLSSLANEDCFREEVERMRTKIKQIFGKEPKVFRNSSLIYSNDIGATIADMGFKGMLTEGAKHILGWKSPHYLYHCAMNPNLKLLLRDFKLSDDISLRFSNSEWNEYPLFADKYIDWIAALPEEMRNDIIVMEITFENGKTLTKAITVSLLEDGTFFAKFDDYEITAEDSFIDRPDSEAIGAAPVIEDNYKEADPNEPEQIVIPNSITFTGTIIDNVIESLVPIILVDVEENSGLSYDKVLFELTEEQKDWELKIGTRVQIVCSDIFQESTPPIGNLISITEAAPNDELKIADEAARAYYENTVFEVVSLELKSQTENEISFSVCVSKGGIVQEPDRTIFLEFVNGHWEVVNEGY